MSAAWSAVPWAAPREGKRAKEKGPRMRNAASSFVRAEMIAGIPKTSWRVVSAGCRGAVGWERFPPWHATLRRGNTVAGKNGGKVPAERPRDEPSSPAEPGVHHECHC